MQFKTVFLSGLLVRSSIWDDSAPIREELFGASRLQQHAYSLAGAQTIATKPEKVQSLRLRLVENDKALTSAYELGIQESSAGKNITPAAEWLLDNYSLVEKQILEIKECLPAGFYRQLPKLASGPFAGFPRIFEIAWAFVAHTDSTIDEEVLTNFILAYQEVQILTIGELWALAITIRIVLIENLRRLSDQITRARDTRELAGSIVRQSLDNNAQAADLDSHLLKIEGDLSDIFFVELFKQIRDHSLEKSYLADWLNLQLAGRQTSIDLVISSVQQRQGASHVSVRNVITSLRTISTVAWNDVFESVSIVDRIFQAGETYALMDFSTRNAYRSAVEQLARGTSLTEVEVTRLVLKQVAAAAVATGTLPAADALSRQRDPGYYLIAEGRAKFEKHIGFQGRYFSRPGSLLPRSTVTAYVFSVSVIAFALAFIAIANLTSLFSPDSMGQASRLTTILYFAPLALLLGFLFSDTGAVLVNRFIAAYCDVSLLPALELEDGVPATLSTLLVIPALLVNAGTTRKLVEQLEIHFLSGPPGHMTYALLLDSADADFEKNGTDAMMLEEAALQIDALNLLHGPGPDGARFLLLYRCRRFNRAEQKWMGWERKRGKLEELNRLLRGAQDTSYVSAGGRPLWLPPAVRYVITLDADSRLPLGAALRLIGKMAHPLNQPVFDPASRRVVRGYGILQPRVTPMLPLGKEGSLYQRIFSSNGGIDPYAASVSDVYQDLFGEGSFIGKGIYHVDAFSAALEGRIPENSILSHDLFEGIYARSALVTDIEIVEAFPDRYDTDARRHHRWIRGDWQLLPWLALSGKTVAESALSGLGLWKIFDNLRRSLINPVAFFCLLASWFLPLRMSGAVQLIILGILLFPLYMPLVFSGRRHRRVQLSSHLHVLSSDIGTASIHAFLKVVFLPDQAVQALDAIFRTLARLKSRKNLLEWTSSAQISLRPRVDCAGFYRQMLPALSTIVLAVIGAFLLNPSIWILALPLTLIWLASPTIAFQVSRGSRDAAAIPLNHGETRQLRLVARQTWRYFEKFVTAADNMLPPDNFQADPAPVLAHRTSPTNIGLYLLSATAAHDFGWISSLQFIERCSDTLGTLAKLAQYEGHFYNWYDTQDLRPLDPPYVSSVDSGNLAGHLIALANACDELSIRQNHEQNRLDLVRSACADALDLLAQSNARLPANNALTAFVLDPISAVIRQADSVVGLSSSLRIVCDQAAVSLHMLVNEAGGASRSETFPEIFDDVGFWLRAIASTAHGHAADVMIDPALPDVDNTAVRHAAMGQQLAGIAAQARGMALAMNFVFLTDKKRGLLSIGYSVNDKKLDTGCYDLLTSEARLASLFAIAKGDLPGTHWFKLGRNMADTAHGSVMLSWSGSMFEYLMPALVMRAPEGSLLEQTNKQAVRRQQHYAQARNIPWGISESAYNARDIELTYQYSNFGVPGLGLKRGLSDNLVIAPYATGLATMIDGTRAAKNYRDLEQLGALGQYGYYDAVDFTARRLPLNARHAVVHNFMAHHQGMTIVAIANALQGGRMRARFHREPIIQAADLLLQEKMPRHVMLIKPRTEAAIVSNTGDGANDTARRWLTTSAMSSTRMVDTHILSNDNYAVMLTSLGYGYSVWRGMAITRWHADATRDSSGACFFLRDRKSGHVWSAAGQSQRAPGSGKNTFLRNDVAVQFSEDRAVFTSEYDDLETRYEVLIAGEENGEGRQISLTNRGQHARQIDLTSYLELVLAKGTADASHMAFSKLFVVTEYHASSGALIAHRKTRTSEEQPVWVAHFAVFQPEQGAVQPSSHETDREKFIGRNNDIECAQAIHQGGRLGETTGTVLDPVFSLRFALTIDPGQTTECCMWTLLADTRAGLMNLIDQYRDRGAFERAGTLAWTRAQVQHRHLEMKAEEATDLQRLATPLLYPDLRFRSLQETIAAGSGPQSGLWQHAISGDLPIIVIAISSMDDMALVHQFIRGHTYWQMKHLNVDLVILNTRPTSYIQDLQNEIESAIRNGQQLKTPVMSKVRGNIFALRRDLMAAPVVSLILSVARIVMHADKGLLHSQLERILKRPHAGDSAESGRKDISVSVNPVSTSVRPVSTDAGSTVSGAEKLEFFNGLGGFDKGGTEYVTILDGSLHTPLPWINVIANDNFGFQVSAEGSGYTWAQNSKENQLTPWSNDPVSNVPGECLYVRDRQSGELWSATPGPVAGCSRYVVRHGFGYSSFEHEHAGLKIILTQFVPLTDPVKISCINITNQGSAVRLIDLTAYSEWVLGTSRISGAPFIVTSMDENSQILTAKNPWNHAFSGTAFAAASTGLSSWTADRTAFLGRSRGRRYPESLVRAAPLSSAQGAGLDPCAALTVALTLAPGETKEVSFYLGQAESAQAASDLVVSCRDKDAGFILAQVAEHWKDILGAVQVRTPDRAFDIMLNGWLIYQTLACRIQARCGFYQASGAYGFRDQLQDGMALTFRRPLLVRNHLVRAAGRQFAEGDVQHWWLPHSGAGVRTRISDDRVWLAYATARYIDCSGDAGVLDEEIGYLDGPLLPEGEHDAFFVPGASSRRGTLLEHCTRGLEQAIALTGTLGLPLMGTGDWNDGMNRVGEKGVGQSVWLGWLLIRTIRIFSAIVLEHKPQPMEDEIRHRVVKWLDHAEQLACALEAHGWDGDWYRRATFDNGTWLGSKDSPFCTIDAIAQSWAVLSGAADPVRAARAMQSVAQHLIQPDQGMALLFTPPFDINAGPAESSQYIAVNDPGYIAAYPPGLRENGGQYSHAAMWNILAYCKLADGNSAEALFSMLNPVNHASDPQKAFRYRAEPYVVAADVYSVSPHAGRAGWSWYTGSAGWMAQAGLEGILGITRHGSQIHISPCLPDKWPGYEATIQLEGKSVRIVVENAACPSSGQNAGRESGIAGMPVFEKQCSFDLGMAPREIRVIVGARGIATFV